MTVAPASSHHVEPRVKLHSSRKEPFPVPLKYIDVSRSTRTNLDVTQKRCVDDYWNVDGSRDFSDSWTGSTDDKQTVNTQDRSFMVRTLDEIVKKCPAEGEAKVVTRTGPS